MIGLLKQALALPVLFDAYQAAVGANHAKTVFVDEFIRPASGMRMLDIGCGTGAVVPFLPDDIQLVGVDVSQPYIDAARRRFSNRGKFLLVDASDPKADFADDCGDQFDVAYAFGVLHHLPDELAASLIRGAMQRLKPGGRLVTIDPTLTENQSAISRCIVSSDRGEYVRSPEATANLFGSTEITVNIRRNLLRIPFQNVIITANQNDVF